MPVQIFIDDLLLTTSYTKENHLIIIFHGLNLAEITVQSMCIKSLAKVSRSLNEKASHYVMVSFCSVLESEQLVLN